MGLLGLGLPLPTLVLMFIIYTIIVFLAVPIIVAILLIRDITRIIKDLDPIAWYKRWYRILAFCALILILIMVVLGLGASGGFQTKPVGFSIVNVVAGEHSVQVAPSVAGEGLIHVIKVSFLIISLTIIAIVFVMTAYVTFFIDETESNKRRVSFASDIFKTILGFLTGLITAVFGLR